MYGLGLSFNQPKLCTNATWNRNATTFADESSGAAPVDMFVDYSNRVFVVPFRQSYIYVWSEDNIRSQWNLNVETYVNPTLFVSTNDEIYFQTEEQGDIYKLSKNANTTIIVKQFNVICRSLFIDINNTLYCSAHEESKIFSSSLSDNNSAVIVVAGNNLKGSSPDELDSPYGIFVDSNFDLYVTDNAKNRIRLFRSGKTNGTTVAGEGIPSGLTLEQPADVVLDMDGQLFIVDRGNHRVIRVKSSDYQCIAACAGVSGSSSSQLYLPETIYFDSYGNFYVGDIPNTRIQKFTLVTKSCSKSERRGTESCTSPKE